MAEPRWLSDEEQCAWRAFLAATRQVFDELDRELQVDAGMPHTYYMILVSLSEAAGRCLRMTDLARVTGSSLSRLSHAVNRLESFGWVERRPSPDDRRSAVAVLTDAGMAVLVDAAPGHVAAVRANLFDRLTPAQVRHLREVFEAVLAGRDSPRAPEAAGGPGHRVQG